MSTLLSLPPLLDAEPEPAAQCTACGARLLGLTYRFADRPGLFCERCAQTKPRCYSCGVPVAQRGWRLHDGRSQCARCHEVAVYDPQEAQGLFDTTIAALARHPGLTLRVPVVMRLVDLPTMQEIGYRSGFAPRDQERTQGMYYRSGATRAIYLLHGLPRLTLREVIAHEFGHAWQGENNPFALNPAEPWCEGFAEWVAYHHLRDLGALRAAERIRSSPTSPYLQQLGLCLAVEAQDGIAGVLATMRRIGL